MDEQHTGRLRVGNGLDVHAFCDDPTRALVLAGLTIPDAPGLAGHSDADVVAHAAADALLGAAARGDLGARFGVSDPELAGVASVTLLEGVAGDLRASGWDLVNLDATVVAARPRLAPHRSAMRKRLAEALGVDSAVVSVKLTTTDGLGAVGRGEGIACWVTCLLRGPRGVS